MSKSEKESLFSFEVAVKTVFLKRAIVCKVPVVAVRLLEYPTLELKLVTDEELKKIRNLVEKDPGSVAASPQILELQHSTGTYAFTQGKSCMIKIKLSEFEKSLCGIPVYVMVLDVLASVPKLVASFALSLENVIRKIVYGVTVNGIEVPCAQGERDVFPLYNLMGSKVGEVEMGVRLSSLGINMLQHVKGIVKPEPAQSRSIMGMKETTPSSVSSSKVSSTTQTQNANTLDESKPDDSMKENVSPEEQVKVVSGCTQTSQPEMPSKYVQHPAKVHNEDADSAENIFCPPALYYDKKTDDFERNVHKKQQKMISEQVKNTERSIKLSDLQNDPRESVIVPSSLVHQSYKSQVRSRALNNAENTEKVPTEEFPQSLRDFPILRALVEEVKRLGLKDAPQHPSASETLVTEPDKEDKKKTRETRPWSAKARMPLSALHKTVKKQPEHKGPLKFGMTNTMRLRMAMTKESIRARKETDASSPPKHSPKSSKISSLGQTFTKAHPAGRSNRRVRMVSTACGPDSSMYRRTHAENIQQKTVYMGRVPGYEEGTDLDVPSMGLMTSESQAPAKEDDIGIEDLMIVKDIGTPRAHSRQSQRSIEIHLPTASTEFTIGRDDDGDWDSTFSDKERLLEKSKALLRKQLEDEKFHASPKSPAPGKQGNGITDENKEIPQSDASESDRYKYSDDFEDEKTWSPTRTPYAMTPINSSMAIKEEDEEEHEDAVPSVPNKSVDSTITTTRTSDFTNSVYSEIAKQMEGLRIASAQKITSSDEAADTSSASRGSIVTALTPMKREMKVGNKIVPEPIPSDSPVIQSVNTESGSIPSENFPDPVKHSLTSNLIKPKKKTSKKPIHLPESIGESSKTRKKENPVPKLSRLTPSPPSTRKFSPLSSPESSRERIRRMYHHPGRRTRPTSSGSGSSDFDKPASPPRRSDSVSSYQPSEISDVSNVKLSEELDNLSDILSEETESQEEKTYLKRKVTLPADGPKTYFGKPQLDPSTKLGYTT